MVLVQILLMVLSAPFLALAGDANCGGSVSALQGLSEVAQQVEEACGDDLYKNYSKQNQQEISVLNKYIDDLNAKIKKVAVSANKFLVNCGVETLQNPEKVMKCRFLKNTRDVAESRLKRLSDWQDRQKKNAELAATEQEEVVEPPCVSSAELQGLATMETFDPQLYSKWNECRNRP